MRLSYSAIKRFQECPTKFYLSKQYKVLTEGSSLAFGKALDEAQGVVLEKLKEYREKYGETEECLDHLFDLGIVEFEKHWHTKPVDKYTPEPEQVYGSTAISYYQSDYDSACITEEAVEDLTERFGKSWDEDFDNIKKLIKEGKEINDDQQLLWVYTNWWSLKEKGALMLTAWIEYFIPKIEEVLSVQEAILLSNGEGDTKSGYIDAVLKMKDRKEPVIWDFKTASRAYDIHEIISSSQLMGYLAAVGSKYKTNTIAYGIVLKAIKKNTYCNKCGHLRDNSRLRKCAKCDEGRYTDVRPYAAVQTLFEEVPDWKVDALLEDSTNVLTAIHNNVKYKNAASCMNYNRKCDFYDICWNNKDPKTINTLEVINAKKKEDGNGDTKAKGRTGGKRKRGTKTIESRNTKPTT